MSRPKPLRIGSAAQRHAGAALARAGVLLLASSAGAQQDPPEPWHARLKGIEAGPGRLDLGFSLRARYEVLDNFDILGYGTADDDVLLLRTRLSLEYRFGEDPRICVEGQDARYWFHRLDVSDFPGSSSYLDLLDLRQAYFEWRRIGESPVGIKLGRQILLYGDRRVFAPAEWGNVGNYWWDGAKVSLDASVGDLDGIYARRVLSEPHDCNLDHHPWHVAALYWKTKGLPVALDAFYVFKYDHSGDCAGERGAGDERRHTLGIFSERRPGEGWDGGLFAAGQAGSYGRDDILAFGAIARAGWTFSIPWSPRVGLEVSYASGDRDPADGEKGTFDGIFGAMDMPYGWMNIVSWKNLEDYAVSAAVQPMPALRVSAEYHCFRLAQRRDAWYWVSGRPERRDRSGRAGSDLGHEIDLIARWQALREVEVMVGGAAFLAGRYLHRTPGSASGASWAFVQFTYGF